MKPKTGKEWQAELAELRRENERLKESIMRIGTMTNTCTYHDLNRTICDYCRCGRKEKK